MIRLTCIYFCVALILAETSPRVTAEECSCSEVNEQGPIALSCNNHLLTSIPNLEDISCRYNLTKIDLSDNDVTNVTDEAFASVPQLQILLLQTNRIFDLDKDVFKRLPNLQVIDLRDNGLLNINPDIFRENTRLEHVKLSGNPLVKIDTTSSILTSNSIVDLDLQNCKLTNINKEMFSKLPNLNKLDLSYNNLQSLSPTVFGATPQLHVIDIYNNRWNCGCDLKELVLYAEKLGGKASKRPTRCYDNNKQMKVWSPKVSNKYCPDDADKKSKWSIKNTSLKLIPSSSVITELNAIGGVYDEYVHNFMKDNIFNVYSLVIGVTVVACLVIVTLGITVCMKKLYKENKSRSCKNNHNNRVLGDNSMLSNCKARLLSNSDEATIIPVYSDTLPVNHPEQNHMHVYERIGMNVKA